MQRPKLGFQGADAAIELALREEVREVPTEVCVGEAPEVPLAPEAWPMGEYRMDLPVEFEAVTLYTCRLKSA